MNDTIMLKEIMEQSKNINDCHNYNNEKIKGIAASIKSFKPQNIVIVGRGTSIHAGIYAKHLLELYYHIPVSIAAQSIFTIYDSYTDMSKSLVIGISQSGGGKDTLTVLKKANESGALTVAIVNNLESGLAKEAQHLLYCDAGKAVAFPATKTFVTSLYLITNLVYELTKNEHLKIEEEKIIQAIEKGIESHKIVKEKADSLKNSKNLIVLGRGLSLSLAMETGLKIKEACKINVNSYPISEFYHGPIATINKDTPAIVFDFENQVKNDVVEIIKRLDKKKMNILLISNDVNLNGNKLLIHQENPIYAYFEAAVIIQLLTCELALSMGYNPDYDVELDKLATF